MIVTSACSILSRLASSLWICINLCASAFAFFCLSKQNALYSSSLLFHTIHWDLQSRCGQSNASKQRNRECELNQHKGRGSRQAVQGRGGASFWQTEKEGGGVLASCMERRCEMGRTVEGGWGYNDDETIMIPEDINFSLAGFACSDKSMTTAPVSYRHGK